MRIKVIYSALLFFFIGIFSLKGNNPERVVSLAPSLTRSIYYLEAQDQLVGHTSFCYIALDDNKEVVASAISVNVEKVITLKPDLVVTTALTNAETIALIRRAGIRTEVFETPRNFEEILVQFEKLGVMVGKREKARSINSDTRQRVENIRSASQFTTAPKFFFQIGANPLFTVLENTFMDDYITMSGGRNIAAGLTRGSVNREFVLTSNPDVIIIVNMGIASDEEKKIWERYPFLGAVQNKRIFFLESDMASTPNPPDFVKTMEAIRQNLGEGWWKD